MDGIQNNYLNNASDPNNILKMRASNTVKSESNNTIKIKSLNDNKPIGLLLISLINESSKLIKEYENLQMQKKEIIELKNAASKSNIIENKTLFNYTQEKQIRQKIFLNFENIYNILSDKYELPNKVIESIFVLLIKMFASMMNTLEIKTITTLLLKIYKALFEIFIEMGKINTLYEILNSKKIIENIIKHILMLLENFSYKKQTQSENDNSHDNNNIQSVYDKETLEEIFYLLEIIYYPQNDNFKISLMPGLISKIFKFFISFYDRKIISTQSKRFHLPKKIIFSIFKIFNYNFYLLLNTKASEGRPREDIEFNIVNFLDIYNLFFSQITKIILDNNEFNNIFKYISFEIKIKSLEYLGNYKEKVFATSIIANAHKDSSSFIFNLKSFLHEINFSGYLMKILHMQEKGLINNIIINKKIDLKKLNNPPDQNLKEESTQSGQYEFKSGANLFIDYFYKINFILQKYSCSLEKPEDYINSVSAMEESVNFDYLINFSYIFDYQDIRNLINEDLKMFEILLNKNEFYKLDLSLYRVTGLIKLFQAKVKLESVNIQQQDSNKINLLNNEIIEFSFKYFDKIKNKIFKLRNKSFLEIQPISKYEFQLKNISNEFAMDNINKLFLQFFVCDNILEGKRIAQNLMNDKNKNSLEQYSYLKLSLKFIENIFFANENKQKSHKLNDSCGNGSAPHIANLFLKTILQKNLLFIKNIQILKLKMDKINEEILFFKTKVINNYSIESQDESESEQSPQLIEVKEKMKDKLAKLVNSIKENFFNLLENLLILVMSFLSLNINLHDYRFDCLLLKNFRQQAFFIYSNFLDSKENDTNLFYLVTQAENEILKHFFKGLENLGFSLNSTYSNKLLIGFKTDDKDKIIFTNSTNKNSSFFLDELIKSLLMTMFYFLFSFEIKGFHKQKKEDGFNKMEIKQILMFSLINFASNESTLLKCSSVILVRILNLYSQLKNQNIKRNQTFGFESDQDADENNFKDFVISNFDFILNSIMKKLIFNEISSNQQHSMEIGTSLYKEKRLEIISLFYSLILLILEINDDEIKNFYSLELNKFMNKLFVYLDVDIKNKDIFKLDCALEIFAKITKFQDQILKEDFLKYIIEQNKFFDNLRNDKDVDFSKENLASDLNYFSEFLKNKSNFCTANVHRRMILRIIPLFLSNVPNLIFKFLKIFSNCCFILFMLPTEREENTNFSSEDPSNVKINYSLGPILYESWDYFIYVIKSNKTLKTLQQINSFIIMVAKFHPKFFTHSRIFEELIPSYKSCFVDSIFKNYELNTFIQALFSGLFTFQFIIFLNFENNQTKEKLPECFEINDDTHKNLIFEKFKTRKFMIDIKHYDIIEEFFGEIKKYSRNKLDSIKLRNLIYNENSDFDVIKLINYEQYKSNNVKYDNQDFFDYISKENKNIFNIGNMENILKININYLIHMEIIEFIKCANFDFKEYLDYIINLFVTSNSIINN